MKAQVTSEIPSGLRETSPIPACSCLMGEASPIPLGREGGTCTCAPYAFFTTAVVARNL